MKSEKEQPGQESHKMSMVEAEEVMTEPMYEGLSEALVIELSKTRIAHRLSKHGAQLPTWYYDQADRNVEAFFTMLEDRSKRE